MKKWLQRIRGAVGIGITWAVGWAPVGAIVGWVTGVFLGAPLSVIVANYAMMFGVLGFIGGAIFSTVLRFADGRRSFNQLSVPRFVAWGALGGLMLGGLAVGLSLLGSGLDILGAVIAGTSMLLGAGSAAGTLVIARAADSQALLKEGEDVTGGLIDGEAHHLLSGAE